MAIILFLSSSQQGIFIIHYQRKKEEISFHPPFQVVVVHF